MKCVSMALALALAVALCCAPSAVEPSNILAFVPSVWKSHVVSFEPLFLELARRGHNVTVVSQFAVKNPPANYTQVIVEKTMDFDSITDMVTQDRNKYLFFFEEIHMRIVFATNVTETYVSSPSVQRFIAEDRSHFDLVIVESFFQECTVAMGHKYGAPVIGVVPVAPWVAQSLWAANPSDFAYVKDFKLNAGKSIDFPGRLLNAMYGLYGLLAEPVVYLPAVEAIMDRHFRYPGHEGRPRLADMLANVSLSLIDSDVRILSPRPYVPSFIEVPGIHIRPSAERRMNEKLKKFMDGANAGVVYFNFGTIINMASFPKRFLKVFVNVLGRLQQKVIFSWPGNDTQGLPDNFYVDSWFPQLEILRHPNCKLFITHGGVHGLMETVDAGVPFLGFPFFGDQFQNLRISQENGFGIMSDIFALSEDTFERDVKLLLTDQKFKENAEKMSSIFHDRPMSAVDTAIYWVEYVIRHKGAHHLRSPAVQLTWYQFYLLDVIAFFVAVALSFAFACHYVAKRIARCALGVFFKRKID